MVANRVCQLIELFADGFPLFARRTSKSSLKGRRAARVKTRFAHGQRGELAQHLRMARRESGNLRRIAGQILCGGFGDPMRVARIVRLDRDVRAIALLALHQVGVCQMIEFLPGGSG
ncbi:hypothetical protein [Paraburkholderia solisilvae]|uniref:hypothetical protein n=1 Tax=Paraburkholderia solisilvae TaxID=624376 RepID=UPI001581604D|nr:hypothetical protein [Paraburkholderia solisilvae]